VKFKQPPAPDQEPEPALRDDVRAAVNRCPFCHDEATREASVACQGCLARHHQACWEEGGARCAACGNTEALVAAGGSQEKGTWPSWTVQMLGMGFAVGIAMPVVLWLKLAHGIERIGPVSTLALPMVPLLVAGWLTFLVNARAHPPARRRLLGAVVLLGSLLLIAAVVMASGQPLD
jgi:hypothetical protein